MITFLVWWIFAPLAATFGVGYFMGRHHYKIKIVKQNRES